MKVFATVLGLATMALAFPKAAPVADGGNSGNQCTTNFEPFCCNNSGIFGFSCFAQGIFGAGASCSGGQTLCCQTNENQIGLINIGGCLQI